MLDFQSHLLSYLRQGTLEYPHEGVVSKAEIGHEKSRNEDRMSEPRQLHLFGLSLNPVSRLKSAMRQTIKECRFSREQICDRMNRMAISEGLGGGRSDKITVAALDAWVAESKTNTISVNLLPIFCQAAESLLPLRVLADCMGAELIDPKEAKILALAKLELEARKLAKRKKRLQSEIEESTE